MKTYTCDSCHLDGDGDVTNDYEGGIKMSDIDMRQIKMQPLNYIKSAVFGFDRLCLKFVV